MLTAQQQVFVQAIEELDLPQVQRLLAEGLDPNFIDAESCPCPLNIGLNSKICKCYFKKII